MVNTVKCKKEGYSQIRNEALAYAFSYMNLIEHWGSGIPRIIEKVKAAGLREPEFIGGEVDLRVNIYRGQVESAGKVPETVKSAGKVPENEQEKKIYEYVIETGNVRTVDVEALLEVGSRRARIILRKMVERGWLEKKGNSKKYCLYKMQYRK